MKNKTGIIFVASLSTLGTVLILALSFPTLLDFLIAVWCVFFCVILAVCITMVITILLYDYMVGR